MTPLIEIDEFLRIQVQIDPNLLEDLRIFTHENEPSLNTQED